MPNFQTQIILIHNGTTAEEQKLISKFLSENDLTRNIIKNKILCVDVPENLYKVQEFLGFDEFTYIPMDKKCTLDINTRIDKVFICFNEGTTNAYN